MNTYNIFNQDEPGTILYHAIAETTSQVVELAERSGIDLTGMIIQKERSNVRPQVGQFEPTITHAIIK